MHKCGFYYWCPSKKTVHSTLGKNIMSETDANGTILNQTIDEEGRITGISISNRMDVDYIYDKGTLKEIIRTDTSRYVFKR